MTAAQAGDGKQPPSKPANTRLAARIYAEKFKWRVFPVHYPLFTSGGGVYCSCKKRGKCGKRTAKHPVTKNGLKDATTDLRKINAWWDEDTSFNVAVATGAESGIFVLDIDVSDTKHGDDTLEALEEKHGKLPDTVEVITGSGGRHLYFKHPGNIRIKSSVEDEELGKGIDVRGDGGYVLAPPSMHMSGRSYGYEASSRPTDVPLAEAPQWLLDLVKAKPKKVVAPGPPIDDSKWPPLERRVYRAEKYAGAAKGAVSGDGGSNMTLKLALALVVGFVLPSEEALRILEDVYNPKCDPPWSHDELVHKVESCATSKLARGYLLGSDMARGPGDLPPMPEWMDDVPPDLHDQRPVGNETKKKAEPLPEELYTKLFETPIPGDVTAPPVPPSADLPPPPPSDGGPPPPQQPPHRRPFVWELGDHSEMASALAHDLDLPDNPLMYDEGEFWRYDGGIWEKFDLERVEAIASGYSTSQPGGALIQNGASAKPLRVTDTMIRGGIKILRARLMGRHPRLRFANARRGVCFRNGFVTVKNGRIELQQHSMDHLCRHKFDFDFDPNARHAKLDGFIESVFANVNEEERAGRAATLQEFIGACLIGEATKFQKCLLIHGDGGGGKSSMIDIAESIFPPGSVAKIQPQHWGERFQSAVLVGKLANFCHEIPEKDITHGDAFKSIVTGDEQYCDIKHRAAITYKPIAGHIFSANTLPGTVDQSPGFWARWIIVPFTRNFRELPERRLNIAEEIVRDEKAGIVLWALHGAARLQVRGRYEVSAGSTEEIEKWRSEADPVRLWVLEVGAKIMLAHERLLTPSEQRRAPSSHLYRHFRSWGKDRAFQDMTVMKFGRRLQSCGLLTRVRGRDSNSYVPLEPLASRVRDQMKGMSPGEASALLPRSGRDGEEEDQRAMSFLPSVTKEHEARCHGPLAFFCPWTLARGGSDLSVWK